MNYEKFDLVVQFSKYDNGDAIPTGSDDLENGKRHVILDVKVYNCTTSLSIKTFWDVGNYCLH